MPKQAHAPHGSDFSGDPKARENNFREAADLDRKAEKLEIEGDRLEKAAKETVEDANPLGDALTVGHESDERGDQEQDMRIRADKAKREAKELRDKAQELRDKKIESVLDDVNWEAYSKKTKPPIESVVGDVSMSEFVKKPKVIAGVAAVVVGVVLIASFGGTDRSDDVATTFYPGDMEGLASYAYNGATYYPVKADVPAENTGNEVCALHGKQCKGYTGYTTAICQAFHPGAQVSKDLNGSKAGFYCNGAPQGGICAKEANTCHICPECNVNMECSTEVGDLYRETYVECS